MKKKIEICRNSVLVTLFYYLLNWIKAEKSRTFFDYVIIFFVLTALLYIFDLFSPLRKKWLNFKRKYIWIKVGILNGSIKSPIGEHGCVRVWTNITPSMWYESLRTYFKLNRKLSLITTSEIDDNWRMIINPFGDNFPEEDLRLHKTFYKICDYINKGGIFVVTGGSFFAHQNTIASTREERFITHIIDNMQNLEFSPLFQEFGVVSTGDIKTNTKDFQEPIDVEVYQNEIDRKIFGDLLGRVKSLKRFRSITSKTSDFIPVIRQKTQDTWTNGQEIYPLCIVRYGEGALVHAGLYLDSADSDEFKVFLRLIKKIMDENLI